MNKHLEYNIANAILKVWKDILETQIGKKGQTLIRMGGKKDSVEMTIEK